MALLIDGYNLIHGAAIVGRGIGPGGLERARQALLDFLVASLDAAERAKTTIVFDAEQAPPGLPRAVQYQGLSVRFASGYADADELIEELIRQDSAPRRLTVVSSDHRLHRAARRRRATAVDSDVWYAALLKRRAQASSESASGPSRPALAPEEIERLAQDAARDAAIERIFPPGYAEDVTEDD